jgi:hypothetical protein
MLTSLRSFIDQVKNERDRIQGFDEATTRQHIVQRILHILGWDIFDELIPEYQIENGRVDFAVQVDAISYVFLEVKRVGASLEDAQEQLLRYAFQEGVNIGILTSGVLWWLYLPLASGSWEQRRFFAIDLLEQESQLVAEHFIRFLDKERVISGDAVRTAEEYRKSRQRQSVLEKTIPLAWNKLITEVDDRLIDLLNDTAETLSGYRAEQEMLAKFVSRHRDQFLIPAPESWVGLSGLKRSAARTQSKPPQTASISEWTGTKPTAITLKNTTYPVESWKEVLFKICSILHGQDPAYFEQASLSLRGRKRPYFSKFPDELRGPEEFKNTGIYVETNQSASSIYLRCRSLLALFDYNPDDDFRVAAEQ